MIEKLELLFKKVNRCQSFRWVHRIWRLISLLMDLCQVGVISAYFRRVVYSLIYFRSSNPRQEPDELQGVSRSEESEETKSTLFTCLQYSFAIRNAHSMHSFSGRAGFETSAHLISILLIRVLFSGNDSLYDKDILRSTPESDPWLEGDWTSTSIVKVPHWFIWRYNQQHSTWSSVKQKL